jgi:hypothetical protein
VLKAFSDIMAQFAQIDPHRKKPLPKIEDIRKKIAVIGIEKKDRPGTVPGGIGRIREGAGSEVSQHGGR